MIASNASATLQEKSNSHIISQPSSFHDSASLVMQSDTFTTVTVFLARLSRPLGGMFI
jgi:hypothetical protein